MDIQRAAEHYQVQFEALLPVLDTVEELGRLATDLNQELPGSRALFDSFLEDHVACQNPPPRPDAFTLQQLISGKYQLPVLPNPGYFYPRFRCLISKFLFGQISLALLGLSIVNDNQAAESEQFDQDRYWQGLWTVFKLTERLTPLEQLYSGGRRLDAGLIDPQRFNRIAGNALALCSGPKAQPIVQSLPFPFPGFDRKLPQIDLCRIDKWNETERALRCFCTEFYHIERIENCSPGREGATFACIGDCIDIFGYGFDNHRRWEIADRRSEVLFLTATGDLIAATEYLPIPATDEDPAIPDGWSENRIRLRIPEEAIPGEIVIRVLCRTTTRNQPLDPSYCRFPTRLPSPASKRFLRVLGPSLDFRAINSDGDRRDAPSSRTVEILAEACSDVTFEIEANSIDTIQLTDDRGVQIELPDIDETRAGYRVRFSVNVTGNRTYTVTATSPCLSEPLVRSIAVISDHRVYAVAADTTIVAGSNSSLHVRLSCPVEEEAVVTVRTPAGFSGVSLPGGETFVVPAGANRSISARLTTISSQCGSALFIPAMPDSYEPPHRPRAESIEVTAVDVATTVMISVSGVINPAILGRTTFGTATDLGPFPATFSADRMRLTIVLPPEISIAPITLRPNPTTIVAAYNGVTSEIRAMLSTVLDESVSLEEDGRIDINLSTSNDLRSEFGMSAPVGNQVSRVTRRGVTTYDIVIAGADTVIGGLADGRRIGLGIRLKFPVSPPLNCGQEPWSSRLGP